MERWRDVVGYEGIYRVSDRGRVLSLARTICCCGAVPVRKMKGCILRPDVGRHGHLSVTLCGPDGHKAKGVHRIVLEAFVGPCPCGKQCAHYDGNPKNNRLSSLRWATSRENHADKIRHGTVNCGERNGIVKLCQEQVIEIRQRAKKGESRKSIVARFPVSRTAVDCIITGKTWKHLLEVSS